jgi:transcription elongation factor GreA
MQRYPMTPEGKVALEKELQQLKTVDRPRITQAIAEAREHGDLKKMLNIMLHVNNKVSVKVVFRISKVNLVHAQVIDVKDLNKTVVLYLVLR